MIWPTGRRGSSSLTDGEVGRAMMVVVHLDRPKRIEAVVCDISILSGYLCLQCPDEVLPPPFLGPTTWQSGH